ncbi:MAG: hypothetical protein C4520_07975 [Candidatus Abyssobacteria bacterium SURF_5]|uniref:Uncharacterized protein n=1 Tax=Abyssobacteria bacterium (strain SURF_5) TaxID=2093360 RepID=A0A3A4NVE8_ABYX5|nr:MAG: hypothetical protein C4520_07975 [Candidatus Abyssubacteria bacterium SURF_5]
MDATQKELKSILLESGANLVGFADVSDMAFHGEIYLTAVSIGISYDRGILDNCETDVDAFERHLQDTKDRMKRILEVCGDYLQKKGSTAWIPPISKNLPGLLSDFPHKLAATKAGLGWIGKNALFVSAELGCGLRLATVLTKSFMPCVNKIFHALR